MKSLALLAVLAACDSPAVRPAPVTVTLPSGVTYTTLVVGHGPHPAATDWVVYYGGPSRESREHYYLPKPQLASRFESFVDVTTMAVGEKRRYLVPGGPAKIEDIELVAILGPTSPQRVSQFPPPSDAETMPSGDRFVIIDPAKTTAHPELGDRVDFSVLAFDRASNPVVLPLGNQTQTLGDVPIPQIVDTLHAMSPGETRNVWTTIHGAPTWLRVLLYSVDKRPQVPAPPDLAHAPANAQTAPGVRYVVLAPGTGEPPDSADSLTLEMSIWSTSGRTIVTGETVDLASGPVPALGAQLTDMRTGEHRRIWIEPSAAGYLSEAGRGAVADIRLVEIKRNIELLPDGIRIVHSRGTIEAVRGPTRVGLPGMSTLESAVLANGVVTFTGEDSNEMPVTIATPLAEIRADFAATTGDLDGLAKAVALAPDVAQFHLALAAAYVKAGRSRDAAQTLVAIAAKNPVWLYQQIQEQPELAVLANESVITQLRVRSPATIDLAKMPVVANGRFLAVLVDEGSWGSGDSETRVEIIEIATGVRVAMIAHVMWSFMSQTMTAKDLAELRMRKHVVESWLADLGFANVKDLEGGVVDGFGHDPKTVTFAKAQITIKPDGTITRGKRVIAPAVATDDIHGADWLPTQHLLVVHRGRAGHECCESTDPEWVDVLHTK